MGYKAREVGERRYSEAWWIRALDHELTPVEQSQWEAHLETCEACRAEWAALVTVDQRLREGGVPAIPVGLEDEVVVAVLRAQRHLRALRFVAAGVLVMIVGLLLLSMLGVRVVGIGREIAVLVSARRVLMRSLIQIGMVLVTEWKTLLPYIIAITGLICVTVTFHGALVTLMFVWLAQQGGSTGLLGPSVSRRRLAPVLAGR